jgi:hypothetical protein
MTTEPDELPHLDKYVQVTFERLVKAHLEDALDQLNRWEKEPLRLFLAARSIHLALVTALSSALSGTDGTGAMADRDRRKWIEYFENTRAGFAEAPGTRMASFNELLERAQTGAIGWLQQALVLGENEKLALQKLTALRDWTEHPRPDHHFIEPTWMKDAMEVGLALTRHCTDTVWHRYDPLEQKHLEETFRLTKEALARL